MASTRTPPIPGPGSASVEGLQSDAFRFDLTDLYLFRATDIPTRLAHLQRYFFPRFRRLVTEGLSLARQLFGPQTGADFALIHHPNFRRDAAAPIDTDQVMVGLAPRRQNVPLAMTKPDGTACRMGPGQLLFRIRQSGGIQTLWQPYRWSDQSFRERFTEEIRPYWPLVSDLLAYTNISVTTDALAVAPLDAFLREGTLVQGPIYPLPLVTSYAHRRMLREFVVLFPLLEAATQLARRAETQFERTLSLLLDWHAESEAWLSETEAAQDEELMGEASGYVTIRPRRWYAVLMRDNWTCCSCGRSTENDGVALEVDHIVPRSKGGKDDESNLQTLCRKCNVGKSNLDDTPLRSGQRPASSPRARGRAQERSQ